MRQLATRNAIFAGFTAGLTVCMGIRLLTPWWNPSWTGAGILISMTLFYGCLSRYQFKVADRLDEIKIKVNNLLGQTREPLQRAFEATPEQMGQAAVEAAKPETP